MLSRTLGYRAPLLWVVLPLIAGLAAGKASGWAGSGWQLGVAGVAITAAAFGSSRLPRLWAPLLLLSLFLAGLASHSLHRLRAPGWSALPPREAKLAVRVDRVFPRSDGRRASGLGTVMQTEEHLRDLLGQRLYFALSLRKGQPPPVRSAVISMVGLLATLPPDPPANSFDNYLADAGMNFRLTRARVLALVRPANAYYRFCARTAVRCHTILGDGIAEKRPTLAGLLRAMMLGQTNELSDEQHTLFMQSGTMHLFAISGLNIGVIAAAMQALLLLLRLPPFARFAAGTTLLWLFVDVTGAAPSAVRAFLMAVFVQAAFVLRRPANLLAALAASALVVLIVAPLQVFSASFLMSYGIVTALLVLGVPLGEAWLEHWTPWRQLPVAAWRWWQHAGAALWRGLARALAVGLATTLVSVLTGIQFFGLVTPGALVANLILIPAAMAVTLGGFASVTCGLAGFTAGAVLCNHAAALVLWGIEWVVRIGVSVPGAFLPAYYSAAWIGTAALSVLMATLIAGYAVNWRRDCGWWCPPFAVVAVTLLLGVEYDEAAALR